MVKSKKVKASNPYSEEFTVLVSVRIDSLKAFSNVTLSKLKILDKINMEIIKVINTKKAIFESSSLILDSVLNKFLLNILIGLANL